MSAKTERENRFVTLLSVPLLMKLPPKYLNKSKCEKRLNLNHEAPCAMKVKIILIKYSPAERQNAKTYDLNIVDMAIAMRAKSQILNNNRPR